MDGSAVIGQPTFRTMRGFRYYHTAAECPRETAAETCQEVEERLEDSIEHPSSSLGSGPIVRWLDLEAGTPHRVEVGYWLNPAAAGPPGHAALAELPPFPCVSLVYQGAADRMAEALPLLAAKARDLGLVPGREYRQHALLWEDADSPANVLLLQLEVSGSAPTPHVHAEAVRIHGVGAHTLLYVGAETDAAGIEPAFHEMIPRLEACQARVAVQPVGPMRYISRPGPEPGIVLSEVAIAVPPGTPAPAGASVRDVPPQQVASLVCSCGYASLGSVAGTLNAEIERLGVAREGQYVECYLHFEGDDSPNTITQMMYALR